MRTTTRNLEMKANIAILYVGQLECWRSNLQRKLLVLVVCVWRMGSSIGSPESWCKRFFIMTAAVQSDRRVHPTLCTLVLTIRLRVVIHDKLDL